MPEHVKITLEEKEILEEILPEAFAVVREAGKRVLSMRHFDVQLLGGIILHQGQIAEMISKQVFLLYFYLSICIRFVFIIERFSTSRANG